MLGKLRVMPIERWRFRGAPGLTHIGPVTQDFYEAFGLGTREQNDALVRENEILKAELAVLRERLSQLEARQP